MQSGGISFYGDVVLWSFNKAYRNKDGILDQKYEKQIFWDLYYEDFNFKSYWGKCILKEIQTLKTRSSSNWVLVLLLC